MKKLFKIAFIISVITCVGFIAYIDHSEKENTYTVNIEDISSKLPATIEFDDTIVKHLVLEVEASNYYGDTEIKEVTYMLNDEVFTENPDDTLFNYMSEENISNFKEEEFILNYMVEDNLGSGSVSITATVGPVLIRPIKVDTITNTKDGTIEVYTSNKFLYSIDIDKSYIGKQAKDFLKSGMPSVKKIAEGREVMFYNAKYESYIKGENDELMFEEVFEGFELENDVALSAFKEAFYSFPTEVKNQIVLKKMRIKGIDIKGIELQLDYGDEITKDNFYTKIAAYYSASKNEVVLNLNKDSYSEWGKKDNNYYGEMKEILYHEVGHFLDNNTDINTSFTQEEKDKIRKTIEYGYEADYDREFVAYGFEEYFNNPEYIKNNLPFLYDKLTNIIEKQNTEDFFTIYKYMELREAWDMGNYGPLPAGF